MINVIIIDDEKINQIAVKRILEKEGGIRVLTASSAKEGIEIIKCEKIDYVLLDIEMPETNGFEAAPEIRQLTEAKIIFFTGSVDDFAVEKAQELGVDKVITKPVTKSKLLELFSLS